MAKDYRKIAYNQLEDELNIDTIKHSRKKRLRKGFDSYSTCESFTVIGCLKYGNFDYGKTLALNPLFISSNKEFVNDGIIIKICLKKGLISIAKEFLEAGYAIPDSLLLKSIKKNNEKMISNIINSGIYNNSKIELEYWYLLYNNYIHFAELLRENEESLSFYLNKFENISSNTLLIRMALQRALERKFDSMACIILKVNPKIVSKDIIDIALSNNNLEFLRRI